MITKRFECAEHEEYGNKGWREIGKNHFDPLQGIAVAHDCLEHFPNDNGDIDGELEALGAMLYIRGENPDRRHEPWEDMESDMTDLYRLYRYEGVLLSAAPPEIQHRLRGFPEEQITKLVTDLPDYLMQNEHHGDRDDDEANNRAFIADFAGRIEWWLRHGYRRARRRFGPNRYGELYYFFKSISEKADDHLRHAVEKQHELIVKFCIRQRHAEVTVHDNFEYDGYDPEDE